MSARGLFVVLDGLDGCGKSTQAALLVEYLAARGGPAPVHVREPGSTPLGERIRELLLHGDLDPVPAAEALLFAASRRQMLEQVVETALRRGADVVCERFHGSTFAYQAVAGGLDGARVLELLGTWCGAPAPDLELILELDPKVAWQRRGADRDRMERRGLGFQERVAAGLREYGRRVPGVRFLDGSLDRGRLFEAIVAEVERARSTRP